MEDIGKVILPGMKLKRRNFWEWKKCKWRFKFEVHEARPVTIYYWVGTRGKEM